MMLLMMVKVIIATNHPNVESAIFTTMVIESPLDNRCSHRVPCSDVKPIIVGIESPMKFSANTTTKATPNTTDLYRTCMWVFAFMEVITDVGTC
mmetsp:Transcript_28858/g.46317  ORF Transcript_28858/g.46317 Transcript_28858/m.46317 type:complete len:94 (-) Transcript_28858:767-1048(-)